jgi:hypothetical protein
MTIPVSLTNIPRIYATSFEKKVIFAVISWKFRVVTGDAELLRFKRGIFSFAKKKRGIFSSSRFRS